MRRLKMQDPTNPSTTDGKTRVYNDNSANQGIPCAEVILKYLLLNSSYTSESSISLFGFVTASPGEALNKYINSLTGYDIGHEFSLRKSQDNKASHHLKLDAIGMLFWYMDSLMTNVSHVENTYEAAQDKNIGLSATKVKIRTGIVNKVLITSSGEIVANKLIEDYIEKINSILNKIKTPVAEEDFTDDGFDEQLIKDAGEPIRARMKTVMGWIKNFIQCNNLSLNEDQRRKMQAFGEFLDSTTKEHIGTELDVTCKKHIEFIEFWDDRAIQVIPNTGITVMDEAMSTMLADEGKP
jgi:hypothetical protein